MEGNRWIHDAATAAAPRGPVLARPLVIGHRGASAYVTENTMEAFVAAREAGADGVELDVQRCATGEIVVFHDVDVARLSGRGGRIAHMSLAEIRDVRLNHDRRIPTLQQVLCELGRADFLINVEIKSPAIGRGGAVVDGALACIERHCPAGTENLLVSSFDPFAIGRVRRKAPHLATGLLFHRGEPLPLRRAWAARLLRPATLHPEAVLVDEASMASWTRHGYAVNPWTVDEPAAAQRLARLGVRAIITNDPAAVRRALEPQKASITQEAQEAQDPGR